MLVFSYWSNVIEFHKQSRVKEKPVNDPTAAESQAAISADLTIKLVYVNPNIDGIQYSKSISRFYRRTTLIFERIDVFHHEVLTT
jgi:hypothetical protein